MASAVNILLFLLACPPALASASTQFHGALRARQNPAPVVDLGYASYRGVRLDAGVDEYLGMRYAQAPLGDLRFRAPRKPLNVSGIQDASTFSPLCVGAGETASANLAEDCLFANVFTPSNRTANAALLPVWLFIQGGGYARLGDFFNGTGVVRQSGGNIIFVNFNYRVGALGFLATERLRPDGDLNAGLQDQRRMLNWLQEHIAKFGGDPARVVIHGPSAGAGSVAHHLTAYGGDGPRLFAGAVAESPFFPTQRTVAESEAQFDRFVIDTECYTAPDALACLRAAPLADVQRANVALPFPGAGGVNPPLWSWLPVTEDDPGALVPDRLYESFAAGRFVKVPLMVGDDTDEGTVFARNASTAAQVATFLKANYPGLAPDQLVEVGAAYPLAEPFPMHAAYFPSAAAAYGEVTFTCPGNGLAEFMAEGLSPDQVWNYRVNIQDPQNIAAGVGVPHVFEQSAILGPGNAGVAAASWTSTNAAIVPVVMMYWISFVRSLNPNTYKYSLAPEWDTWGDLGSGLGNRLKLETNDTVMEEVPQEQADRCSLWRRLSNSTEQ